MRWVGIGTSMAMLGITSGTMPRKAYLASSSATMASAGIAGYGVPGSPENSSLVITVLRSSPVTCSVVWRWSAPGTTSVRVTTPSISTCGMPFTVATTITRSSGTTPPPESRNSVCSGERTLKLNCRVNAPAPSSGAFTSTWVSASSTSCGTGTGTTGPTSKVRCTPSSTWHPRDALGQGDAQLPANRVGQLLRPQRAVRVAQAPELLGIAQVLRRDVVQPLALRHAMPLQQGEVFRRRHEAAPQVGHHAAVGAHQAGGGGQRVAAGGREVRGHGHLRGGVSIAALASGVHRLAAILARAQFGQHLLLALVGRPGGPQLEMRLVDDGLPVAAPFQAQVHAQRADRLVLRRLRQVPVSLEHADVEGDAEVVVGVAGAGVGHLLARRRASLRIQRRLLLVAAQAADHADGDAGAGRLLHQGARDRAHGRQQRGDHLLAAIVHRRNGFGRLHLIDLLVHQPRVDRAPGLRAGLAVHLYAEGLLYGGNHFLDTHVALRCVRGVFTARVSSRARTAGRPRRRPGAPSAAGSS